MRTNVTFCHPAEVVTSAEEDGTLAVAGVSWFEAILRRIDALGVPNPPVQEDWGVVFFANRDGCRFWIGLGFWDEGAWVAHVHHHSLAWVQRFTSKGRVALGRLAADLHAALKSDPIVTNITWYWEVDMLKANSIGAAAPDAA